MKLSVRLAGALCLVAGLSACDSIPTGPPRWETTWITPGEETSVSVVELLPSGLGVNADTSAFVLGFDTVTESYQLRQFCAACPPITATLPKPAFSTTVATTLPLPADIQSAVIAGGRIDIRLTNGFAFDPIRPGVNADSGTISVVIRSGTAIVASLLIDGDDRAFAPGTTLNASLDFVPSTITGDLAVELTLVSPAGDVTTLNPSHSLGFRISSAGVLVSSASVLVPNVPIPGQTVEFDLSDVDLGERLKEGTIFLDIVNPFDLTGTLNVSIDPEGPAGPFTRSVPLLAGTSASQVSFTEAEIEQMVGFNNVLTVNVTVPGGQVTTVQPDDVITVATRLRVTIEVGGSDDNESQ